MRGRPTTRRRWACATPAPAAAAPTRSEPRRVARQGDAIHRSSREHAAMVVPLVALLVLLLTLVAAPARAADPSTLTLTTTGGYADDATPLSLTLTAADGTPLAGAGVVLERRVGGRGRRSRRSSPTRPAGPHGPRPARAPRPTTSSARRTPATRRTTRRPPRRPPAWSAAAGVVTVGGARARGRRAAHHRAGPVAHRQRHPGRRRVRVEQSVSGGPWRPSAR